MDPEISTSRANGPKRDRVIGRLDDGPRDRKWTPKMVVECGAREKMRRCTRDPQVPPSPTRVVKVRIRK
ncbi:hypothetical protein PanWU01x14_073190 [Parasponia andersonii]|uniref:Uncharacterized protein n=1 Tax=Parasponia andersonii TaxID=3476 RepID=A0A2P5DE17_PARAD|nr:hypothetical protein PanWU01x14_073190 [Parasponia andersonii]